MGETLSSLPALIATADPPWVLPAVVAISVGLMTVLIFGLFWLVRRFLRMGKEALEAAYRGIEVHSQPQPGDFELVFDTYYGLLSGGYQRHHHVFIPLEQAEILLNRLHRFNQRWGALGPGAAFIALQSAANFRSQLNAIRERLPHPPADPLLVDRPPDDAASRKAFALTFVAVLLAFGIANVISYFLRTNMVGAQDAIHRVGFPFLVWEAGGFAYRHHFSYWALLGNAVTALGLSTVAGNLARRVWRKSA